MLWLVMNQLCIGAIARSLVEKKTLLSLLSVESSSGSEEGRGAQEMMSELLNKVFSTKATQNKIKS